MHQNDVTLPDAEESGPTRSLSGLGVEGRYDVPIIVPITFELTGITPSTFQVEAGRLVLSPWALELTPSGTIIILLVATLAQYMNSSIISISERSGRDQALDQVHAQSWHLKQLLPRASKPRAPAT